MLSLRSYSFRTLIVSPIKLMFLYLSGINSKCNHCVFLMVLLSVIISGCASNPYIKNTRPSAKENLHPDAPNLEKGTIEYSLKYADDTYDAYEAKLSEEFERQQLVSDGLLTLAASALGLAAYGADTDAILGVGLGGAWAYQLGTWNSNKNRLGIYIEGMKALSCGKIAIAPLRISEEKLSNIKERGNALYTAIEEAANATGQVTSYLAIASARLTNLVNPCSFSFELPVGKPIATGLILRLTGSSISVSPSGVCDAKHTSPQVFNLVLIS
jgi:hypothetical protein